MQKQYANPLVEHTCEQSVLPWRITFALAAAYNLAFGAWAVLMPFGFFDLFGLERPVYPGIWSCLGMVIGLYGLGYAYIAWKPERGNVLALLGLLGKVFGPIGWLIAVASGELPARTFPLILCNDLVWWYPFIMYLLRRSAHRQTIVIMLIVAVHLAGSVLLVMVSGGTEAEADPAARLHFISAHQGLWVACWFTWVAASIGLLTFFALWGKRLLAHGASALLIAACCSVAAIGLAFDLANEVIQITRVTAPGIQLDEYTTWARRATVLGAGLGNGFYCIAGIAMSVAAWRAGALRRGMLLWGLAVWLVGFALSAAAFTDQHIAMTASGAVLMVLFIPWLAVMGWRFGFPANAGAK